MFRFLAGVTVAAAVAVALIGVFAIFQAAEDLIGAPTPYSAETINLEHSRLRLVGARGDALTFYLADNSVKGLWAAPVGLRLDLERPNSGFRTSAQAIAPKQKNWTDPVFYFSTPGNRGAGNDFEIRGSLTVPHVPGPQTQTLSGRLEGEFLNPGATEDGLHFSTVRRQLDIPATLKVVSKTEGERISSDYRVVRWRWIVLGIVFAVVAFGYSLSYGMWKDREQTRRWEPYLTLVGGIAVWACFAGLWLRPFD